MKYFLRIKKFSKKSHNLVLKYLRVNICTKLSDSFYFVIL